MVFIQVLWQKPEALVLGIFKYVSNLRDMKHYQSPVPASGRCTLFLDEYHHLFTYEMSLKEQCLRVLLEIAELIFCHVMLRQKNCP